MAAFRRLGFASQQVAGTLQGNQLVYWQAPAHNRKSKADRVSANQRLLRVLVVEDDPDTADALSSPVRRWGHAARLACDEFAAVRVAVELDPDVILLDLDVPLMDGCQVARQLRLDSERKDCLIIAVTEQVDEERRQQCCESGIDLLLIKPVDHAVVETLLLLECELVNRSWEHNGHSTKVSSQFTCQQPSASEIDSAAKTAKSRLWQALRADTNRHPHETGGSSC